MQAITDEFLEDLALQFDKLDDVKELVLDTLEKNLGLKSTAACLRVLKSRPSSERPNLVRSCLAALKSPTEIPALGWGSMLSAERKTSEDLAGLDYFTNPMIYRRGGKDVPFTQKRVLSCEGLDGTFKLLPIQVKKLSSLVDNVVVLTDGTCGSACSQFISKMYVDNLVTTVSFGGVQGEEMDISAFNGGDVKQ
jgi:hypothetical protein